jgi:hypothetical protein
MRRLTRLAAVAVPLLAIAAPAAAAQASDDATAEGTYRDVNGHQVSCPLSAHHEVDTDTGHLSIRFTSGGAACRGTITIDVHYVNRNGADARAGSTSLQSPEQDLTYFDVGSTKVTVDYAVSLDGCTFQCTTATLETSTK